MGVRVPRITLNADFGDESAFGELSLLSVGYGLHQAWVYATMFGTASVFGPMPCFQGLYGSSVTIPYLDLNHRLRIRHAAHRSHRPALPEAVHIS